MPRLNKCPPHAELSKQTNKSSQHNCHRKQPVVARIEYPNDENGYRPRYELTEEAAASGPCKAGGYARTDAHPLTNSEGALLEIKSVGASSVSWCERAVSETNAPSIGCR